MEGKMIYLWHWAQMTHNPAPCLSCPISSTKAEVTGKQQEVSPSSWPEQYFVSRDYLEQSVQPASAGQNQITLAQCSKLYFILKPVTMLQRPNGRCIYIKHETHSILCLWGTGLLYSWLCWGFVVCCLLLPCYWGFPQSLPLRSPTPFILSPQSACHLVFYFDEPLLRSAWPNECFLFILFPPQW